MLLQGCEPEWTMFSHLRVTTMCKKGSLKCMKFGLVLFYKHDIKVTNHLWRKIFCSAKARKCMHPVPKGIASTFLW